MPGIVAFLAGYIAVYLGYPLIFLSYFYSHFCGRHILQIKYIAIYGYIQKGIDAVGVAGGRDGHPEEKIAEGCISHGRASYEGQLMGRGTQEAR